MPSSITPELVYELTSLSGPSLSPDGTLLAYTRSRVDKQAMESRSRVMVMRVADGEESAFTGGPRDSRPRFSPDGTSIAFLRRDDKETRQLWVIATSGGEARQLTSAPGGVHELSWAPDSSALAFASDVDPDRPPDGHDPKRDPRVRVASRIRYRADTLGWRGDAFRHLFVTDVLTGDTRQLTDGEGDDSSPVWCPDGTSIAFISDRGADHDLVSRNEAYVVSSERGEPQQWSQGLSTVAALAWSPNGERLAVIGSDDDEVGAMWQGSIFVLAPRRGPAPSDRRLDEAGRRIRARDAAARDALDGRRQAAPSGGPRRRVFSLRAVVRERPSATGRRRGGVTQRRQLRRFGSEGGGAGGTTRLLGRPALGGDRRWER